MPIQKPPTENVGTAGPPPPPPAVEAAVVAHLSDIANGRTVIEIGEDLRAFVLAPGQRLETLDLSAYRATPARKIGSVTLDNADSFVTYVGRYLNAEGTTLWADIDNAFVTAVFDDHARNTGAGEAGTPAWRGHRAVLELAQGADWAHWLKRDGQLMSQDEFAEHLEDGVDAIVDPDAATMLELAQTFHATSGCSVDSSRRLSGEIQFSYTEQTTATAGRGSIEIPQQFTIALSPFEGTARWDLTARFRFRLHDKHLRLGYRLIRPDVIRREALDSILGEIATGTGLPIMLGTP